MRARIIAKSSAARSGALAAQLIHASADHRKIVSGSGSGHVSFVLRMRSAFAGSAGSLRPVSEPVPKLVRA
jgi:hypothetical protein